MRRRELKATSVAEYIVGRLAAEGISHCFGVAGDYVFPICDAVDSSAKMKWIGCANELNASDDLWRRRAVGPERRDGRQGGAIPGLSHRWNAVLSAPTPGQDRLPF
jgi:hypothetical protein